LLKSSAVSGALYQKGQAMEGLERKLNYTFRDRRLLSEALNHSSYANEHRGAHINSNERLEFLGDSVLGFVTAEFLFVQHPNLPEGDLTRIRAALVCEQSLYEVAQKLELGAYLKLGKGEEAGGGRTRTSILADATEAVFAAVYLDGGIGAASALIHRVLLDAEREEAVEERRKDYKTALQELVQRQANQELSYHMAGEQGPDHNKTFQAEVRLNGEVIGVGSGHSKKEAEQSAAKAALETLGNA
jgi:ribonuclease-3